MKMSLDDAIQHLAESIPRIREESCGDCAQEHEQLKIWLEELRDLRNTQVNENDYSSITNKIIDLQKKQHEILFQRDKQFLEKAEKEIGRCFYDTDRKLHVMIIGTPVVKEQFTGYQLNRHQYPAIFVGEDEDNPASIIPIFQGEFFVESDNGIDTYTASFYEINQKDFYREFQKQLDRFQREITRLGQKNLPEVSPDADNVDEYPDAVDGDIYYNPLFGDHWIVQGDRFIKINENFSMAKHEPSGFIKVGHIDFKRYH